MSHDSSSIRQLETWLSILRILPMRPRHTPSHCILFPITLCLCSKVLLNKVLGHTKMTAKITRKLTVNFKPEASALHLNIRKVGSWGCKFLIRFSSIGNFIFCGF